MTKGKKITKKEAIEKIAKYIKDTCAETDDAPGLILIPTFRTNEQIRNVGDDGVFTGVLSNVQDHILFQLAILSALRNFVKTDVYKKSAPKSDGVVEIKDDAVNEHAARVVENIYSTILHDCDDASHHLSALIDGIIKGRFKGTRDALFLMLPANLTQSEDFAFDVEDNSGMYCSVKNRDDFVRMISTAVLAACHTRNWNVEETGDDIFKEIMTAQIVVGKPKDKKEDE